jgi:hypothetical protein
LGVIQKNKDFGSFFEELFLKEARRSGFFAIKNHLTARFVYAGKLQVIPGELDFTLIDRQGRVGFFDCKAFDTDFFSYSRLDEHQIARAVTYNNWRVPSGFVVWLRKPNRVILYSGHIIARNGPRSRFEVQDGLCLGRYERFDLRPILSLKNPPNGEVADLF